MIWSIRRVGGASVRSAVAQRPSAPTLHLFNMRRSLLSEPGQSADAHRRRKLTSRELRACPWQPLRHRRAREQLMVQIYPGYPTSGPVTALL
ncbi:hypothetical protein BDFB_003490 [Asbolus verrucosus]|uniref:Uncharacterized protein n=1 Tax=Asbolus verrucosus TaxID=1661398 RepID=A0A482VEH0_ASBVE|nr:hypothetical protein BDFB_003490 [Asbolus verrucosus]